jgi:hypothetical protein
LVIIFILNILVGELNNLDFLSPISGKTSSSALVMLLSWYRITCWASWPEGKHTQVRGVIEKRNSDTAKIKAKLQYKRCRFIVSFAIFSSLCSFLNAIFVIFGKNIARIAWYRDFSRYFRVCELCFCRGR